MSATAPMAAVLFDTGHVDTLLAEVADTLTLRGLRVRGVVQSRGVADTDCHCAEMFLTTIGSRRTFRISQSLGNGSRGCRLDPGVLAECAAFLEAELRQGADLLILNRFGRGESEGRGFRDLIGTAFGLDIPVLTAVGPNYTQAWTDFGGGMACSLPMRQESVFAWLGMAAENRNVA